MSRKSDALVDKCIFLLGKHVQTGESMAETITRILGERESLADRLARVEQSLTERMSELHAAKVERDDWAAAANRLSKATHQAPPEPVPLILHCPECGKRHIDPIARPPHRTHACQFCGFLWAPGVVETIGVRFLPGCEDKDRETCDWMRK